MRTLDKLVRWACLLAGLCGLAISAWVFIDPGAFPQMSSNAAWAPPSPRWRAAFVFLFALLLLGYGTGRLRKRELP